MINTLHFSSDYEKDLLTCIQKEVDNIGYYNLPEQDTNYIDNYLEQLDKIQGLANISDVVVIGIGGSSLGTKAVYHFRCCGDRYWWF